uniref:Uncharacterized protein n=1 Tax=Pipistrellus kuhlii TaxID=59472 RepID=A0A7J7T377_PIPKU|nr:hypothetical protein mPipKuh1_009708 [Pipistrellus kuhlii]
MPVLTLRRSAGRHRSWQHLPNCRYMPRTRQPISGGCRHAGTDVRRRHVLTFTAARSRQKQQTTRSPSRGGWTNDQMTFVHFPDGISQPRESIRGTRGECPGRAAAQVRRNGNQIIGTRTHVPQDVAPHPQAYGPDCAKTRVVLLPGTHKGPRGPSS